MRCRLIRYLRGKLSSSGCIDSLRVSIIARIFASTMLRIAISIELTLNLVY